MGFEGNEGREVGGPAPSTGTPGSLQRAWQLAASPVLAGQAGTGGALCRGPPALRHGLRACGACAGRRGRGGRGGHPRRGWPARGQHLPPGPCCLGQGGGPRLVAGQGRAAQARPLKPPELRSPCKAQPTAPPRSTCRTALRQPPAQLGLACPCQVALGRQRSPSTAHRDPPVLCAQVCAERGGPAPWRRRRPARGRARLHPSRVLHCDRAAWGGGPGRAGHGRCAAQPAAGPGCARR